MTLKNNRAPLLSNNKLYASFHHHMWFQTGVTVRKRLSGVMTSVTLTFDLWPWPFVRTSLLSLVITPENFMMIRWWEHSEKGVTNRQTDGGTDGRADWTIHRAAWSQLKIMTSKNNRAPVLCYVKLSALFQSHQSIQTWVTVRKCWIRVKICNFLALRELEIWWMTLENNRAPLLCNFKLGVSFHSHWSIQTGVTVWKHLIRNKMIFCPVRPWNLMYNIEKQLVTSSVLLQALCIIS